MRKTFILGSVFVHCLDAPSDLFFAFAEQNYTLLIFLLIFSFLFPSLGRARIFHHNRAAQAIVSAVLAIGTAGIVHAVHWDTMTKAIAALVAGGIVSLVVWSVTLQRGKTKQEQEFKQEQDRLKEQNRREREWRI